jgi:CHAT domain-containing protein
VCFDSVDFTTMLRTDHRAIPRYLAFVLPGGRPDALRLVDLGAAREIDRLVGEYLEALRPLVLAPTRPRFSAQQPAANLEARKVLASGQALCECLLGPLRTSLSGCRRLFIAGDAALRALPLAALPLDTSRSFLDEYEVGYLHTGRDLLPFSGRTASQPSQAVVVADPDFELATLRVSKKGIRSPLGWTGRKLFWFASAPGTRLEAEEVRDCLPSPITHLQGAEATKGRLKSLRSPWILHLALPSFYLFTAVDSCVREGLALAGANSWLRGDTVPPEAEDGLLTAEDVRTLDLAHTQLVVVSSAEAQAGDRQPGETTFRLGRAFREAGARGVILPLGPTPDHLTAELMVAFYRRLAQGSTRTGALREAQLEVRARTPGTFAWAAWACYGDPGAVEPAPRV